MLGCRDPEVPALFWCEFLYFVVLDREDDGSVEIGPREGFGGPQPTIILSRRDDPENGKSRLHIDVNATDRDQDAEVERLLKLEQCRRSIAEHDKLLARTDGVRSVSFLDLNATPPFNYAHDHFGFRDRLSQPVMKGSGDPAPTLCRERESGCAGRIHSRYVGADRRDVFVRVAFEAVDYRPTDGEKMLTVTQRAAAADAMTKGGT